MDVLVWRPLFEHGWCLGDGEHQFASFVPYADGLDEAPSRKVADADRAHTMSSHRGADRICHTSLKEPAIEGRGDRLELDQMSHTADGGASISTADRTVCAGGAPNRAGSAARSSGTTQMIIPDAVGMAGRRACTRNATSAPTTAHGTLIGIVTRELTSADGERVKPNRLLQERRNILVRVAAPASRVGCCLMYPHIGRLLAQERVPSADPIGRVGQESLDWRERFGN